MHAGRSNRQGRSLAPSIDHIDKKPAALQVVSIRVRVALLIGGLGPQAANIHLARTSRHLCRLPSLFIDVSLDHLGCQTRRQLSVLAALEEHTHDNVRIPPWSESNKPPVLIEILIVLMLCAQ